MYDVVCLLSVAEGRGNTFHLIIRFYVHQMKCLQQHTYGILRVSYRGGGTPWNFPSPTKVFPLQKNIFPLQRKILPLQRKYPSSLPHTKTRFPYPTATPSTILFLRVKYDICLFSQHLQSLLKVRE